MVKKTDEWVEDEIIDPEEGIRTQKVNTEFYLGRLSYKAAEAGVYAHMNPQVYKNAVLQIEIYISGSRQLDEDYWERKKKLTESFDKKKLEIMKNFNPNIKKSKLNPQVQKQLTEAEIEYINEWHRLIMMCSAKLYYTFWQTDVI